MSGHSEEGLSPEQGAGSTWPRYRLQREPQAGLVPYSTVG